MTLVIPSKKRARRPLPQIKVVNPGKGLNTVISESLIDDKEASDLNNIMFVEGGAVAKRYGHTQVGNTLSNNPKGMGVIYTSGGTRQVLTVDGTALKYLNSSTWTSISGKTFTTAQETNFCQAQDAVYIWNGTDSGGKYDGSTLSTPTTTPSAAFGIYYSGYQIVAGVSTKPSRLYISTSTDPGDFTNATGTLSDVAGVPGASVFAGTGANFVDVALGDGDKITGLSKFGNVLVIFKERSIYQLTFDASGTPTVAQITNSIGAVSHKSIDNVENDVFFLTRKGYYVLGNEPNYFNVIRSNELSSRIHPLINTITAANLSRACSMYSDFVFYSSVASGGTTMNNTILTYDRKFLAWSVGDNVNANAFTEFIGTDNIKHFYYASDDEAKIFEIAVGYSDDGDAISSTWTSKAFDLGAFELYKHFIDVTLLFRQVSGTVNITVTSDNDEVLSTTSIASIFDQTGTIGQDMWGDGILGGDTTTPTNTAALTNNVPYRLDINKDARSVKITVSNANNNETFTMLGFVITYRPFSHYQFPSAQRLYG